MQNSTGKILGTDTFSEMPIIGGGFCTGINFNDAGTVKSHHTDVGGGYVWGANDTEWRRTWTEQTYPAITADFPGYNTHWDAGNGVYAQALAPSSDQIGYLHARGRLFVTSDQFKTLNIIPGDKITGFSNGGAQRLWNEKMVVDPTNPDVMLFGSEGQGAWYTLNRGASAMVQITALNQYIRAGTPENDRPKPILVAVDRTSSTLSSPTRKDRYAAFVPTAGVYISSGGPDGAWVLSNGSPKTCTHLHYDRAGNLYAVSQSDAKVYKLAKNSSTWVADLAKPGFTPRYIIVDIADVTKKAVVDDDNNYMTTVNNAGTQSTYIDDIMRRNYPVNFRYIGNKAAWLSTQTQAYIFPGHTIPDPVVAGRYWIAHGTGIAYHDFPNYNKELVFNDCSQGNEMLVTIDVLWRPNRPPITQNWDKPFWVHNNLDASPATYFPNVGVEHGWALDYFKDDVDFLAGIVNYSSQLTGYTTDGGVDRSKWTPFPAQHPDGFSMGGCFGVETKDKMIWIPSNNGRAVYTLNRGTSWNLLELVTSSGVKLSSIAASAESGWSYAYYFNKRNVIASKNEPGTIYLYNYGPDNYAALRGVWRSDNGVAGPYTQVYSGYFAQANAPWFFYHMKMKEVPGQAGHLFICSGADQPNAPFLRSVDRGASWTEVTSVLDGSPVTIRAVQTYGFGAPAIGKTYPTIRFQGFVNGTKGIYETQDNFATIKIVIQHSPLYIPEDLTSIGGNPSKFGEWVYGVGSSSYAKSKFEHKLKLT